jgi:hypothetical protein
MSVHQYQQKEALVPELAARAHPEKHGCHFVAQWSEFAEEERLLCGIRSKRLEMSAAEFE